MLYSNTGQSCPSHPSHRVDRISANRNTDALERVDVTQNLTNDEDQDSIQLGLLLPALNTIDAELTNPQERHDYRRKSTPTMDIIEGVNSKSNEPTSSVDQSPNQASGKDTLSSASMSQLCRQSGDDVNADVINPSSLHQIDRLDTTENKQRLRKRKQGQLYPHMNSQIIGECLPSSTPSSPITPRSTKSIKSRHSSIRRRAAMSIITEATAVAEDIADLQSFKITCRNLSSYRVVHLFYQTDVDLFDAIQEWKENNPTLWVDDAINAFATAKGSDALAQLVYSTEAFDIILKYDASDEHISPIFDDVVQAERECSLGIQIKIKEHCGTDIFPSLLQSSKEELKPHVSSDNGEEEGKRRRRRRIQRPSKAELREWKIQLHRRDFQLALLKEGLFLELEKSINSDAVYIKILAPFWRLGEEAQKTNCKAELASTILPSIPYVSRIFPSFNRLFPCLSQPGLEQRRETVLFKVEHLTEFHLAEPGRRWCDVVRHTNGIQKNGTHLRSNTGTDGRPGFFQTSRRGYLHNDEDPINKASSWSKNGIKIGPKTWSLPETVSVVPCGDRYALHDGSFKAQSGSIFNSNHRAQLRSKWAKRFWGNQPLDLVNTYFGERIVYIEFWKRANQHYAFRWNMNDYERVELPRTEFRATKARYSPVTVLGEIWCRLAEWLTDKENHKYTDAYEDSLIIKRYLFDFTNMYATLFYYAFFKAPFGSKVFKHRPDLQDECMYDACITELTVQLAVVFIGKQFLNGIFEMLFPWILRSWNRKKILADQAIKSRMLLETRKRTRAPQWVKDDDLPSYEGRILKCYRKTVIQFGFCTLFVTSFPVAPAFALINNWIDIRMEAFRLLTQYQRPIALRAQDIGMWENIMEFISFISVITNAAIIAFSSLWIKQHLFVKWLGVSSDGELLAARLGFILVFEHVVYLFKFILRAAIPTVPLTIKLAVQRSKYMTRVASEGLDSELDEPLDFDISSQSGDESDESEAEGVYSNFSRTENTESSVGNKRTALYCQMAEISSLSSLLKRLEAATTKLEDLAMAGASASNVSSSLTGNSGAHAPQGQLSQLAEANPAGASAQQDSSNPSVEGFDELLKGPVKKYANLSTAVGGLVEEQAKYVCNLFAAQREMILIASLSQKPPLTSDVFRQLLEPTQAELTKVIEIKEKNRSSPLSTHLTAVAEGIPALGWVAIEPKPAPYVGEMKDSGQFYADRVVRDWKEKDENHVLWVRSFMDMLIELQNYVRKFHVTGLVWNPKGNVLDTNSLKRASTSAAPVAVSSAPAPTAGGPPPPPPPPPPPMLDSPAPVSKKPTDTDMSAVFAQLNQGEAITSNLRKVDRSKMTHKNPELRASGMVTASGKPGSPKRAGPGAPPKPASLTLKKPPKLALEGNKWVVEHFENNNEVILDNVEINQSVYIYGCKNSTIQIKGKVTTVAMDSCAKTGLCVESLISSLDVVNSKSAQVQILGRAPTVCLDKVDSCMVYLSKDCLEIEILTSKCSAVNILTPDSTEEGAEGDFVERPVPEQFLTKIVNGKVVTTAVEHSDLIRLTLVELVDDMNGENPDIVDSQAAATKICNMTLTDLKDDEIGEKMK
ncbi:hypothetical protein BGZ49_003877 [Haplosporangium sp. Z 27]|nr:hypothetical protein BGZ49_003877 [Haplosporangium sp. Z 27]